MKIKSLNLVMFGVLLIFLSSIVLAEATERSNDILQEGQTKTYTIGGKDFQVTAAYIGSAKVKFTVNGEVSDSLSKGGTYTFSDGTVLGVVDISEVSAAGEVDKAEFYLEAAVTSCSSTNTLQEGYTKTYTVNGKDYEIQASYVELNKAKITVNGEVTDTLQPGDSYKLADGSVLTVNSASDNQVKFCMNGVAGTEKEVKICSSTNTLQEGSKKTYSFNGKNYDVAASYIESGKAKVTVNGEVTDTLLKSQSYTLVDGSEITISYVGTVNGVDQINFCVGGIAGTEVKTERLNDILQEGDTKLYTVGGKDFQVTAAYIGSAKVKFTVNGEVSDSLSKGGTYTFSDGTVLGVVDISEVSAAGEVDKAEFYLEAAVTAVVPPLTPTGVGCSDSDGGLNYYVKGSGYDNIKYSINNQMWDICLNEDTVLEVYCREDGYVDNPPYDCIYGCKDGACIKEIVLTEKPTLAVDLSNYPGLLISNGKFNAVVVVGDTAPAEDVISAVDILNGIKYVVKEGLISKIEVGAAKLASEIEDPYKMNIISVGNPCNNEISAKIMGNPSYCLGGFSEGEGIIKLYNYKGYVQILVAGYSNADTRKAAKVLANWKDYNLKGNDVRVTGFVSKPVVGVPVIEEPIPVEVPVEEEEIPVVEEEVPTVPILTCRDGIKNQGEEGVDCGGPCKACAVTSIATCADGIQNQGEEGVDCGGPCKACKPTLETCSGCLKDSTCLPFGTRIVDEDLAKYCDITKNFVEQKEKEEACQNNYECKTNQCTDGVCGSIAEELRETRGMLQKILDWLGKLFG